MISPQTRDNSRQMVEKLRLSFPVLSDAGNETARRFGIVYELSDELRRVYEELGLDLPSFNGDGSWTLPMPARYVIDRDGVIRYASVTPDYTVRPDPSETFEVLRALEGGP